MPRFRPTKDRFRDRFRQGGGEAAPGAVEVTRDYGQLKHPGFDPPLELYTQHPTDKEIATSYDALIPPP